MSLPCLSNVDLLSAVGVADDRYIMAPSWESALSSLASSEWESFTQDAQGELTSWLTSKAPHRYQDVWNSKVKVLRAEVEQVVDELFLAEPRLGTSEDVRAALQWDLLLACIDSDYADLANRPKLPAMIRDCYLAGHLPCGYDRAANRIVAL